MSTRPWSVLAAAEEIGADQLPVEAWPETVDLALRAPACNATSAVFEARDPTFQATLRRITANRSCGTRNGGAGRPLLGRRGGLGQACHLARPVMKGGDGNGVDRDCGLLRWRRRFSTTGVFGPIADRSKIHRRDRRGGNCHRGALHFRRGRLDRPAHNAWPDVGKRTFRRAR